MELMSRFYRFLPTPTATSTPAMSPISLGLALLFWFLCQVNGAGSACPADVNKQAHACFSDYNREFQNMHKSPKRLCCGLDAETLRAFCTSYMHAMACIKPLRKRCPHSGAIQDSMKNVHGAEASLRALCEDDTFLEQYSIAQNCITQAGPTTMRCFQRYLNTSDNIVLVTPVDTRHINNFCEEMRGTLSCIQGHINHKCGNGAASLMEKLVKPMIKQSSKCNYEVATDSPDSRQGQPSPSSHDGSWHDPGSASALPPTLSSALLMVWGALLMTRTFALTS